MSITTHEEVVLSVDLEHLANDTVVRLKEGDLTWEDYEYTCRVPVGTYRNHFEAWLEDKLADEEDILSAFSEIGLNWSPVRIKRILSGEEHVREEELLDCFLEYNDYLPPEVVIFPLIFRGKIVGFAVVERTSDFDQEISLRGFFKTKDEVDKFVQSMYL